MADVGVKLPPFERLTLAMDFQSLVNNIVLQESVRFFSLLFGTVWGFFKLAVISFKLGAN